jgi:hypothetical protein
MNIIIFEEESDGKYQDGLIIRDEYVDRDLQYKELVFSMDYESHRVNREKVVKIVQNLIAWLEGLKK